jgi:hypothetical protein
MLTRLAPITDARGGRVRFVRLLVRRMAALGTVIFGTATFVAVTVAGLVLGGGQTLADTPAIPGAPLAGSSSATLTQVNAGEWTTTVYLDTAALCAGKNAAGNKFTLVTGKPNSVTGAAAPQYPDGPLACGSAAASPVTAVKLTFTPSLSAVPQTATLTVTPPQALLLVGDPPVQVPLTVRRTVSPWQYAGIPAICGGALAALLVLALMAIGLPGISDDQAGPPAGHESPAPGQRAQTPARVRDDFSLRLLLFLMAKRHEILVTEMPAAGKAEAAAPRTAARARPAAGTGAPPKAEAGHGAGAAVGQVAKRVRWGLAFWRTPLFAGAAWSFGDSWATSVTPLTALAGGVLAASGAVAGLVPGVDLTRFGLLMALVGGLTTLAPLLFGAVNSLFPAKAVSGPAPTGEVIAARLWVMLLASCLTVFAIGVEIGFVGIVLAFDLIVASPSVRWIGLVVTGLAGLLFLAYGAHSILTLAGQPMGTPKNSARRSSFMI